MFSHLIHGQFRCRFTHSDRNKVKFPLKLPIAMVGYPEDTIKSGEFISESETLRVR